MCMLATGCTDGDVRLTGGSSKGQGTIEVCFNKTWGMVSGSGWGEEDARVVCRQLHFSSDGEYCCTAVILSAPFCVS